ncbi:MAG: response regulator transcription factor, partial [Eubacterium sp.]|nr:response regulator transcription factor [Eubacterium sp.]
IVELLARIRIVLRRYHKSEDVLTFQDMTIDTKSRSVTRGEEVIPLTPKEFDLFLMLVRNVNITLYRDRIYETVWETDWMGDTRTLDLHIQRLRRKLNLKDSLKSVYNTGYRLIDEK